MHGSDKLAVVVAGASLSLIGIVIIGLSLGYGEGDPTYRFGIGLWCGIPVLLAGITAINAGASKETTSSNSPQGAACSGLSCLASSAGCCLSCWTGCCSTWAVIVVLLTMGSGLLSFFAAGVLLGAGMWLKKSGNHANAPLPNATGTITVITTSPIPLALGLAPVTGMPAVADAESADPPPAYSSLFAESSETEQPKYVKY